MRHDASCINYEYTRHARRPSSLFPHAEYSNLPYAPYLNYINIAIAQFLLEFGKIEFSSSGMRSKYFRKYITRERTEQFFEKKFTSAFQNSRYLADPLPPIFQMVNDAKREDRIEFPVMLVHIHGISYPEFYRACEFRLVRLYRPFDLFGINIRRYHSLCAKLINNQPRTDSRAAADLKTERITLQASHFSQHRPFHASLNRGADRVVDYASLYKTKFHGFAWPPEQPLWKTRLNKRRFASEPVDSS